MLPNPLETADLLIFTEEILNLKLNFSCSVSEAFSELCQPLRWNLFSQKNPSILHI